jgi:hypothetical protein
MTQHLQRVLTSMCFHLYPLTGIAFDQCLNCRGVGGLNPQLFAYPPNKMPWDTLGDQFQPPAVVNDAELPVCNDNDNG